jgi:hypothetical protein
LRLTPYIHYIITHEHLSSHPTILSQLWNFLSMKTEDLSRYAFYMHCDRHDELDANGLRALLGIIHGKDYETRAELRKLIFDFEKTYPHATVDDFTVFSRKYTTLTDPIKRLQLVLRQTLIGDAFWKALAVTRYESADMTHKNYVLNISENAVEASAAKARTRGGRRGSGAGKPRKPRSNKYAVAMHQLSKVIPVSRGVDAGENEELATSPTAQHKPTAAGSPDLDKSNGNSKGKGRRNSPAPEVMVSCVGLQQAEEQGQEQASAGASDWKVASKLHPHAAAASASEGSPRRGSNGTYTPHHIHAHVDGSSGSPRRGSNSGGGGGSNSGSPRRQSAESSPRERRASLSSLGDQNAPKRRKSLDTSPLDAGLRF